jgi:peptidoglycan/xylan/chitin deacetylase (PgdA/CDA1 family)
MRQAISLNFALAAGMILLATVTSWAAPMVTEFTYQGRLLDGGQRANGAYDFIFRAYNAACNGAQVGNTVFKNDVPVNEGYFLVNLDFGSSVFYDDNIWIEIWIRPGASEDFYTELSPRQSVKPTPNAFYAYRSKDTDTLDGLDSSEFARKAPRTFQPPPKIYMTQSGGLKPDFTAVWQMDDYTQWTITGGDATKQNDSNFVKHGTQSIKVISPIGDAVSGTLRQSFAAQDFSNYPNLFLCYYVPDANDVQSISFYLEDSMNRGINIRLSVVDGWNYVDCNWQRCYSTVDDGFDASTINEIYWRIYAEYGVRAEVYYDYIAIYGNNVIKPLIIIRFDDGNKSDLEIAAHYMDRYGLRGVSGIVTCRPDDPNSWPNNMTWDEIARLKHDYGWQIANHSYSHMYLLSTIGYENNKAEVIKARDRLIEKGYGADCWLFIVPSGHIDVWPNPILTEGWADGMALVDSSLQYSSDPSHRMTRQGPCPIPRMADPRVTGTTYSGMPYITAENFRTAVDASITYGGLNIFLFHRLVESNPTGSQTLAAAFREFIDYVALKEANGDLVVITYNDLRAGYLYK